MPLELKGYKPAHHGQLHHPSIPTFLHTGALVRSPFRLVLHQRHEGTKAGRARRCWTTILTLGPPVGARSRCPPHSPYCSGHATDMLRCAHPRTPAPPHPRTPAPSHSRTLQLSHALSLALSHSRTLPPFAYSLMHTFFASVKKRKASTPPSRPTPLCFMPPKGVRRSRIIQQFTHTIPACNARAMR